MSARLQGLGNAEFVLRCHPGDHDSVAVQQLTQFRWCTGQFITGENGRTETAQAISRAASGWSPAIMATRMPARRHSTRAAAAPLRGGSSAQRDVLYHVRIIRRRCPR
ncbi:hypothetical protein OHA42_25750 [Nocardia sp. NBC_01009]|nr:hypothetical protein OHA42_25750 [Nocardia sp. NBC_01009]